jgi:multisubunit Na+/H+ antiporter MnhC subunit
METLIPSIGNITPTIPTIEPISILFLILVQIGGRYLKIELTKAQQRIINDPLVQATILFAIILMATKNVFLTCVIVIVFYLFVFVLFNENSKYNVLSKKWLKNENLISGTNYMSLKDIYYKNIQQILHNI